MMKFQHVFPADRHLSVELLTGTSVIKIGFRIDRKSRGGKGGSQVFIAAAVKYRGRDVDTGFCGFGHAVGIKIIACFTEPLFKRFRLYGICLGFFDFFAEHMAGPGQMNFQDLPDIHSRRNAKGVQHQIDRTSVRSKGHIFNRQDAGAYALVTVAPRHFVAFAEFPFLRNVNADELIYARRQFIAVFTGKFLDVDHFPEFSMRHTERCITDFSFLIAENVTEKTFFRSQFCFPFRRYFADKDITGTYIGADTDNTVFIKIFQSVVADGCQLSCDLFFAQLRITGITLVFFNMDRGVQVIFAETFRNEHGVFMVISFPGYERHKHVVSESQLASVGGHAICQCLPGFDLVPFVYDGMLVDAGALVGPEELNQVISIIFAVIRADDNLFPVDRGNHA